MTTPDTPALQREVKRIRMAAETIRHLWQNRVVPNLTFLLPLCHSVYEGRVQTFDVVESAKIMFPT